MLSTSSSASSIGARRQAAAARPAPARQCRPRRSIQALAINAAAEPSPESATDAAAAAAAAAAACAAGRRVSVAPASRRATLAALVVAGAALASSPLAPPPASAAGFRKELKKRKVPLEEYTVSAVDGLRYYDAEPGRASSASAAGGVQKGDQATVHFDCVYRGIDAVSSRYARTLGGNRTVAEPFSFTAGVPLPTMQERMSASGSGGGGLFAGGSGPQPPAALSTAVLGMKPGGRRIVYVDAPELGYPKGNQEIPAGAAFELKIELLSVVPGRK
jgi:peptidylprolyl isomerase